MQYTFSRADRVAEQLHREISLIMQRQVSDPRLKSLTITDVKLSPDLKNAKVYYTSIEEGELSLSKPLKKAAGFVRSALSSSMGLRYTPKVIFYPDEAVIRSQRISALLQNIVVSEPDSSTDSE